MTHSSYSYAPEYERLLRAVTVHNARPITLNFGTPEKAYAMRSKLFSYLRALKNEASERPDLAALAELVQVSHKKGECTCTLLLKSAAWDAEALREALDLPPAVTPAPLPREEESSNSMRQRLHRMREVKT